MATSSTIVSSGASVSISAGQTDLGEVVLSGGALIIDSGGTASHTTILGSETVLSGGADDGALILNGGVQLVLGNADSATVGSGGSEMVASGGVASDTTVSSGGVEVVSAGGSDFGATIFGVQEVYGSAAGAAVASGGTEHVASGGVAGDTVISGGTVEVAAGGALSGSLDFAGAGTLRIDGTSAPAATISGFTDTAQTIDLAGLAWQSGGSAVLTSGNVLQISEGGQRVSLALDPSQNYAGHSFTLASDGAGGTALVDPTTARFTVSSEGATYGNTDTTTLNGVIRWIDVGGGGAFANTVYTIDIATGFLLDSDLLAINLMSGSTLTIEGTIGGGGAAAVETIDGDGSQRGFFVYSGTVTLHNLTLQHMRALGGAGGGGGAGLGGGLFVAAGGAVTLDQVTFASDRATGGAGADKGHPWRGGGGLGGNGGFGKSGGGGGGIGIGADGGSWLHLKGAAGIIPGAAGGGSGHAGTTTGAAAGGASGGGGGFAGGSSYGAAGGAGGGGVGGASGGVGGKLGGSGGLGGFGGGGGGGKFGGHGGFGGGGGGGGGTFGGGGGIGGHGGFGGGGGIGFIGSGGDIGHGGSGGFGGGNGGPYGAGGGLGAGGDVFVQEGASLVIEGGYLLQGTVSGGAAGGSGAGGGAAGAAYGGGMFLQGNETITLAPRAGETLRISGPIADQSGNGGAGGYAGAGALVVSGSGSVALDAYNRFTGGITVSGGGRLQLAALGAGGSGAITFAASATATLAIDNAALSGNALSNTISGFALGQTLDLTGLAFVSGSTAATLTGATLIVTDGKTSDTLRLAGITSGARFFTASDGATGTDVTMACFARGTRIRTPRGERAVERLKIGGKVMTASGAALPVKWIGHRAYDGRFVAGNKQVLPIRITAGALAEGVPARDLLISPEHALFLDGALVPARWLVNGATVVQEEAVEALEYFHIELEAHDVIFAEGAMTETYVDCDNRNMFQNAGAFHRLYPADDRPHWAQCAPRLEEASAERTRIRAAVLARAQALGHALDPDPDPELLVDGAVLRPHSVADGVWRFLLPAGRNAVWLRSRTTVPAEIDPASEDWRRLGVSVIHIALHDAGLYIEAGPGCAALREGFHPDEGCHRWTDGLARLPEALLCPFAGAVTLDLHLAASALPYRLPAADRPATAA